MTLYKGYTEQGSSHPFYFATKKEAKEKGFSFLNEINIKGDRASVALLLNEEVNRVRERTEYECIKTVVRVTANKPPEPDPAYPENR